MLLHSIKLHPNHCQIVYLYYQLISQSFYLLTPVTPIIIQNNQINFNRIKQTFPLQEYRISLFFPNNFNYKKFPFAFEFKVIKWLNHQQLVL